MSEQASTIPPKGLGTIQLSDFWKSLLIAAISNVLLGVYAIINVGGMPTHDDWVTMFKSTLAIIISYLLKNLGTNNIGQLLKKDKPVVKVGTEKLEELQEQADENKTTP